MTTRRAVLAGAAGVAGAAALAGIGWPLLPDRVRTRLGLGPEPWVPDAPEGQVRLETVRSEARGRDVELFTATPSGFGDGAGLPVVVVLHGASARPSDYQSFGLARFVTAAVDAGAPPFVLAGAEGGALRWSPQPDGDDPRRMTLDELPRWLHARGFDADRRALWGWSMGGYGALRIDELAPSWARATAAFSPAVSVGDDVFAEADRLVPSRLGVWCGTEDPFVGAVRALLDRLPGTPAVTSLSTGGHTRVYWNAQTLDALAFLATSLA